jgi:uncharacterized membrane protein YphA (DoxX/SURF4 family)
MKHVVNTARVLVGLLFICSGLVKAIDPLGLAYKMQEFFEAWAADGFMKDLMMWFHGHALLFAVTMISLEVILGVGLLLGIWEKVTAWFLLLLMLFFTFLTSYVLFSGKIRACGCFGDCIPLTPIQTFTKDVIVLILVLLILVKRKHINIIFSKRVSVSLLLVAVFAVAFLQWHVLRHLPVRDCLPYKVGNDLVKLRQMPADAVQDKYEYVFIYEKDGVKKEFTGGFPDSTWKYVDRKQTLVQKGKNNVPLINDFTFTTQSGNDSTEAILGQSGEYYLFFIKTLEDYPQHWDKDINLISTIEKENKPIYIITAQPDKVKEKFAGKFSADGKTYLPLIFTCDVTAIKTAARANPAIFLMNGPIVKNKWSWADFDEVIKQ